MRRLLSIVVCLCLGLSCVVSPQPLPPNVKVEAIYLSQELEDGERVIVALAGAVEVVDDLETQIRNEVQGEMRDVMVRPDGSFLQRIPWSRGESLEIRATAGEASTGWIPLLLPDESGPTLSIFVDDVSDLVDGEFTVSGTAWDEALVIGINLDQEEDLSTIAESSGAFALTLSGDAGEQFILFAIEPTTRRASPPYAGLVPDELQQPTCLDEGGDCYEGSTCLPDATPTDFTCDSPTATCCIPVPTSECDIEGGDCIEGPTTCLPHANPSDYACDSPTATCCIPVPTSECEIEGGLCLSSLANPDLPADCEADYFMNPGDFDCLLPNQACCLVRVLSECSTQGGQCLSSPGDPSVAADCDADYGLVTASYECDTDSQSCCM